MTDAPVHEELTRARPNIVLIMVDDMGFSDIGRYGSEIATPHLDRLAQGGVAFSQMYNCARCCPTRASILTGLLPHQAGVGGMTGDMGTPAYQGYLNDRCVTVAEALKAAGYRTYMSGKWHCGGPYDVRRPETWAPGDATHPTPNTRGFDEYYGMLSGAGNYFAPPTLIHNDTWAAPEGDGWYFTDAISDHAVRMIEDAARHRDAPDDAAATPFFLYVAYTAPHWPLHAPAETIERYRGTYACGWDAVRTRRHETLKAGGLLDPAWPISPRDDAAGPWDDVPDKDLEDARMAVYAAQVDRMDQGVGLILDALDRLGIADDTMVLFLSDNGGCHEFLGPDAAWCRRLNTPLPGGREVRMGNLPGVYPGPADTYQSYQLPWANASNTPFRLFKHWVHEGGIATPLIVRYPGVAAAGAISHAVSHVIDVLPTCLDAAGATYPAEHDGREITPTPGRSMMPFLRGEADRDGRVVYWEHEGNLAVRRGRWKLVAKFDRGRTGPWELYDMVADRTELHDLAAAKADVAGELAALHGEWCDRIGAVPWERLTRR